VQDRTGQGEGEEGVGLQEGVRTHAVRSSVGHQQQRQATITSITTTASNRPGIEQTGLEDVFVSAADSSTTSTVHGVEEDAVVQQGRDGLFGCKIYIEMHSIVYITI
jgi:hypothetical protein